MPANVLARHSVPSTKPNTIASRYSRCRQRHSPRRRFCSRRRLCRLCRGRGRGRGHSRSCRRQVCVLFLKAIRVSYILQLGSERVGL